MPCARASSGPAEEGVIGCAIVVSALGRFCFVSMVVPLLELFFPLGVVLDFGKDCITRSIWSRVWLVPGANRGECWVKGLSMSPDDDSEGGDGTTRGDEGRDCATCSV